MHADWGCCLWMKAPRQGLDIKTRSRGVLAYMDRGDAEARSKPPLACSMLEPTRVLCPTMPSNRPVTVGRQDNADSYGQLELSHPYMHVNLPA